MLMLLPAVVFAQAPEKKPALTPAQQERLKERAHYEQQTAKLRQAGKLEEALAAAEKMLTIEREVLGNENEDVIGSLELIGQMHVARRDFAAVRRTREEVLTIRTKMHGAEDWRVTDASLKLKDVESLEKLSANDRKAMQDVALADQQLDQLYQAGRYEEAIKIAERVLSIRERILGPDHRDTAFSLERLARMCSAQGKYSAAEPLYRRALSIDETALGPDHPETARSLKNLADLYSNQGNYTAAEPLFQRALKIREKVFRS